MTEEQLKNGVLNALIEFQEHQINSFAKNMEKVLPEMADIFERVCDTLEKKGFEDGMKGES